jgi:two-component system OmpR family response regulator
VRSAPRKILLVDDSALALMLEAEILTNEGHDVRTAESVSELNAVLRDFAPDIILTDVKMPDIDGAELCRLIKAQVTRLVPVILFSSLPDQELAPLAKSCGADGFLSKSNGLESLVERVDDLCQDILW